MPDVRIASYASTHDRAFVSKDGRTTFALVYHPAAAASTRDKPKRSGAGGARRRHGRRLACRDHRAERAPRSSGRERHGRHRDGVLVETLLGALGALLVLVFVFRSFMAIVPLLMAVVAIPTTFLLIWPIATVTDVSVIVQFLVALIGLGIAIDYALLDRRPLARGTPRPEQVANETAVRNAMQHAGSAVVFSGTTVAISLLSLLALPMPALRSIGIAGLLIALVSVAVAITLLPVVLATVGPRLDWPRSNRGSRAPAAPGLPGRGSSSDTAGSRRAPLPPSSPPSSLAASQIQLGEPAGRLARPEGPCPGRSRAA